MKKKPNIPQKTLQAIVDDWQKIKALPTREQMKRIKSITFDIYNSYQKDKFSADELAVLMEILQQSLQKTELSSRFSILHNKITTEWLALTGNDQAEIITKKNGKITVKSGMIVLFDLDKKSELQAAINNDFSEKILAQQVQQHRMFTIETGGDGIFNAQLRIIKAQQPVLSAKELKCVRAVSALGQIELPSGKIVLDDLAAVLHAPEGMNSTVEPGVYQVKVFWFSIPNKVESLYVVLRQVSEYDPDKLIFNLLNI